MVENIPKISIVIPTYNEAQNLPILLNDLFSKLNSLNQNSEVIVVNDGSTDDTASICRTFSAKYPQLRIIDRPSQRGMGYSLKEGTAATNGEFIIWLMADLVDDLSNIPLMIEKLEQGADLVLASRAMKGGSYGRLLPWKRWLSKTYSTIFNFFMGVPIHDSTNAHRAFRNQAYNKLNLQEDGFAISPEMVIDAQRKNLAIVEIPVKGGDRIYGITNFRIFRHGIRYFKLLFWPKRRKLL